MIDAHVNITPNGKWFNTSHDASLERLLDEMAEHNIRQCLLISVPGACENRWLAGVVERYPEKFRAFAHLDFQKLLKPQLLEIEAMGYAGVKLHPRSQGIYCLDARWESLFAFLNKREIPVMIDGYYQTAGHTPLLNQLTPFYYDALAKKYTQMQIILSHMGAHRVFDAYYLAKSNPNVWLDNSHVLQYFSGTTLISDFNWVMDMLDEKVIYGSDFPEYSLGEYYKTFRDVCLLRKTVRPELIETNISKLVSFGD
ncbi:MAG: amidohydrolase family protein [Candidatus Cloacimonetes bacterium]|nr:amidohydrolase family protein [Candidatus Cloacimonadota bacterium]